MKRQITNWISEGWSAHHIGDDAPYEFRYFYYWACPQCGVTINIILN